MFWLCGVWAQGVVAFLGRMPNLLKRGFRREILGCGLESPMIFQSPKVGVRMLGSFWFWSLGSCMEVALYLLLRKRSYYIYYNSVNTHQIICE